MAVRVAKRPKIVVTPLLIVSLVFDFSVFSHNIILIDIINHGLWVQSVVVLQVMDYFSDFRGTTDGFLLIASVDIIVCLALCEAYF